MTSSATLKLSADLRLSKQALTYVQSSLLSDYQQLADFIAMKRIFNKFWRKDSSQPQPKKVLPPIEPERLGLKLIYEHENPTIESAKVIPTRRRKL